MSGFNFKDLVVWNLAMEYCEEVFKITEDLRSKIGNRRIIDQLEDSSFSIHSNIAEGKGRYSDKEFVRFLIISRGSLYESISQLIFFNRQNLITDDVLNIMENKGNTLAKKINSLINSIS